MNANLVEKLSKLSKNSSTWIKLDGDKAVIGIENKWGTRVISYQAKRSRGIIEVGQVNFTTGELKPGYGPDNDADAIRVLEAL